MNNQEYEAHHKAMQDAFNLVCNPADWRAPIYDAVIDAADEDRVREAVIYFTATVPTFSPMKGGKLRVNAVGYRNGPAGP
jgi:hypothetical protein